MEFQSLSHRRSFARNVPSGEERGETDVFAGLREVAYWAEVIESNVKSTLLKQRF